MKLIYHFFLLVILNLVVAHRALSQNSTKAYSDGLSQTGKRPSFFELKIIDTDPIVKQAKEVAPFDKPFFVKIKRRTRKAPVGIVTETIKNEIIGNQGNPVTTNTAKFEKSVDHPSLDKTASTITEVNLVKVGVANSSTRVTALYEESSNSEYIFIQIKSLAPEHDYELKITWADNGATPVESYYFTTVASTLDKRLRSRIHPQIGVAVPFFIVPVDSKAVQIDPLDKRVTVLPRLVVGTYYQFRPIDPDIPFKSYKPLALQRFSAYLGLTFNTIAEDNIRADLFGTSNLLIGIGYQPIDALRINVGRILYNSVDPNRIIVQEKKIDSTLYVALTLDVKLKDLLGGIFTTLGFK